LWSPNGKAYAILYDTAITITSDEGSKISTITQEKRINTLIFLTDDLLVFGREDGNIFIWKIKNNSCLHSWSGHKSRIKDLCLVPNLSGQFASISSDGFIKVWHFDINTKQHKLLAETETTARLTCLVIASVPINKNEDSNEVTPSVVKNKRAKIDDEVEEEENSEEEELNKQENGAKEENYGNNDEVEEVEEEKEKEEKKR